MDVSIVNSRIAKMKENNVVKVIKTIKKSITLDSDLYEEIFVLTCGLIQELCQQSDQNVDYFVSAGFIEFALMNPLSVKANDAVFAMIKQMVASNTKA